ncbi:MAG: hypothetical protein NC299_06280 [Lachnospiraceae bacterium]|nr:hypothetical protein [Ruminococcus sp.]MCM1274961.1 hypothetical protein [Lachnospiraceae bacterium]
MKDYEKVAESVFRRSGEIIEENKRRRRAILRNGLTTAGCLAVAGAVGFGVWRTAGQQTGGFVNGSAAQFANDGGDHSGERGVIDILPSAGSAAAGSGAAADHIINYPPDYPGLVGVEPSESLASPDYPSLESDVDPTYPATFPGNLSYITLIDDYTAENVTCYTAEPENGEVRLSDALREAMAAYGDMTEDGGEIRYRCVVHYFKSGVPFDDISDPVIRKEEWDRFCEHGYQCEFETHTANTGTADEISDYHFCMTGSRRQLENFVPSPSYGYYICLYGENSECILADNSTVDGGDQPVSWNGTDVPSRSDCYPSSGHYDEHHEEYHSGHH